MSFVELFFDLVFVFAITQISHGLIAHPSLLGLYETLLLTMAVWWVWIFTSWSTNWADPDKMPVRLMLFGIMGIGLVMSISIPKSFEDKALYFAVCLVAMQLVRTLFMYLFVTSEMSPAHKRNFLLILIWFCFTAVLWIGGALMGGVAQIVIWTIAVLIEYSGPALRFVVPGLGRSDLAAWEIEPEHFAERCGLFIILVLGESILVTGGTFEKLQWTFPVWMSFLGAFLATIAMWAIYFNVGQQRGAYAMSQAGSKGLVARAYTYIHLLIVGGIIVTAVGDEFVLAHATGHADAKTIAALVGGPFLFLLGTTVFKRVTAGWYPLSHLVGLAALAVLAFVGTAVEPWLLTLLTSGLLIAVSIWEHVSLGPDAVHKLGDPRKRAAANAENGSSGG